MNKLITDFTTNYPRATEMAEQLRDMDMPMDISLWISVNASVLMAKLKRGDYSKNEINDEGIDMFAFTYLRNMKVVAEKVWLATGDYSHIKNIKTLQPDAFVEKIIKQAESLLGV